MTTGVAQTSRKKSRPSRGRSMTAAAQVLQGKRIRRVNRPRNQQGSAWQGEAWDYYDKVGEFAWGVDQQAWAVSQVRLVAARDVANQDEPDIIEGEPDDVDEDTPANLAATPAADQPSDLEIAAADLVAKFAGGTTGQQQLLRRVATQLIVSAESYIVGRTVDGEDVWEAYSRDEMKWSSNGWRVDDGVEKFTLSLDDVLIRVWLPSPRKRQEPRSSTKSLLPVLAEIEGLTSSIAAQVDSRLAGAGMLIFPKSVTLVGSPNAGTDPDEGDPFIDEVMDMMITPIKDRDSASAVVPIMLKVDDDAVGKIQYLRFDAPSDLNDAEKREKAMVRLARGMDLPPEQLLGMGESNHWSAWQIDEATIKGPISSLAAIVVHALTIGWFRPQLTAEFSEEGSDTVDEELAQEIAELMVWFTTTGLEQRPDRSEQAIQVFDRGGLSLTALVRETGFSDDDLPKGPELCRVLLLKLISVHPELAAPLLAQLGECAGVGSWEDLLAQVKPVEGDVVTQDGEDVDQRALPSRAATPPASEDS